MMVVAFIYCIGCWSLLLWWI